MHKIWFEIKGNLKEGYEKIINKICLKLLEHGMEQAFKTILYT